MNYTDRYDNYDLFGDIDKYLERPREFDFPRGGNLYPSEASVKFQDENGNWIVEGGCLRKSWYRIRGIESGGTNARAEYIFAAGKMFENFIVEQMKQMGLWRANSVPFISNEFNNDIPVKGELDGVFWDPINKVNYVWECKTGHGFMAKKDIFGDFHHRGYPKVSQLLQTLVYTYHFRESNPDPKIKTHFPFTRLCYIMRDEPANRKTFKVEVQEINGIWMALVDGIVEKRFTIENIKQRYQELCAAVKKDEPPPRDYDLIYSDEKVEMLHDRGLLSESKWKDHESNLRVRAGKSRMRDPKIKIIGDWNCKYCNNIRQCYPDISISQLEEDEET
jgi:hypothetical protein